MELATTAQGLATLGFALEKIRRQNEDVEAVRADTWANLVGE